MKRSRDCIVPWTCGLVSPSVNLEEGMEPQKEEIEPLGTSSTHLAQLQPLGSYLHLINGATNTPGGDPPAFPRARQCSVV